tara:strand:+ start:3829 stop:4227 length:399 start_codon:yes stop_codon:yes gene_type:complete
MNSVKVDKDVKNEEDEKKEFNCIECSKIINGKPWISVCFPEDDYTVHACNYLCARKLKYHVGVGYWDNVVNKEDFNTLLIPVNTFRNTKNNDITTNFHREEIIEEILKEDKRISDIENEYNNDMDDHTEDDY